MKETIKDLSKSTVISIGMAMAIFCLVGKIAFCIAFRGIDFVCRLSFCEKNKSAAFAKQKLKTVYKALLLSMCTVQEVQRCASVTRFAARQILAVLLDKAFSVDKSNAKRGYCWA